MNIVKINMRSRALFLPVDVSILLPEPGRGQSPADYYAQGRKYPVLWLLHGAGGDHETFINDSTLMQLVRGKELMVVMPSGMNSDYANHPHYGTGYNFTDFFFDELMPFIHSAFPASSEAKDNYITGFSMGGSGALLLGFKHPEKFGAILPLGASARESEFLKPYAHMSAGEFRAFCKANPKALPSEYAPPQFGITHKEINMIAKYPSVQAYLDSYECMWERFPALVESGKLPPIRFFCGEEDLACDKVKMFLDYADRLGAENVSAEFLPGIGHDIGGINATLECVIKYLDI